MTQIAAADQIIARLGVEAYRVGGSVRDEIIGKRPKDADYMVRGVGMLDLKKKLEPLGSVSPIKARDGRAQLGWRVHTPKVGLLEITLPRKEANAGSGRKQTLIVQPGITLEEDAQRRDFTFNALYLKLPGTAGRPLLDGGMLPRPYGVDVIDPTGTGIWDLTHRIVRTTHADSFRDDPLRTLRALRFLSTLNADLDLDTREQMTKYADRVDGLTAAGVSGTVLDELKKLLMGQCPAKALRVARDTGVLAVVLPELAPMLGFDQGSRYHDMTTDEHTFVALETAAHVDAPLRVRMALLFHDAAKPEVAWTGKDGRYHYYASPRKELDPERKLTDEEWEFVKTEDHEVAGERIWRKAAKRLNAEKSLRDDVASLIRNHMVPCQKVNLTKVARERVRLGDDLLSDLYLMRMCDLSGKGKKNMKFLANVAEMEKARGRMCQKRVPRSIKDLEIGGDDAKALGLNGRDIGAALGRVLDEVAVDPTPLKLTRQWQLARLEA